MLTAAKRLTTVADLRRNGNPTTGGAGRRIIATRDSLLFVRRRMASRNSRVIHKEEGRKEEREGDAQKREEIRGLEEASEENTGKNRPSSPALYYRPGNTPNGTD